jgi:hypothetical protein
MEHISGPLFTITSNMAGSFAISTTGTPLTVPALLITSRVKSGPVLISLVPDADTMTGGFGGTLFINALSAAGGVIGTLYFTRNDTIAAAFNIAGGVRNTGGGADVQLPISQFHFWDQPGLGSYTYGVKIVGSAGVSPVMGIYNSRISVFSP